MNLGLTQSVCHAQGKLALADGQFPSMYPFCLLRQKKDIWEHSARTTPDLLHVRLVVLLFGIGQLLSPVFAASPVGGVVKARRQDGVNAN